VFARVRRSIAAFVFALALASARHDAVAQNAHDRVYVVQQSDTVSRIAARLQVPVRAVIERNHLEPPFRLRVGRRLRLPDGVPAEVLRTLPRRDDPNADVATADANEARGGRSDDDAASRRGVVTLVRRRDDAELTTRFDNPSQSFRNRIERFLRYRDGSRHGIHPRLLRQLAAVSAHFDGRPIIVLSGFRPQSWRRRGPRTRHSQGYAVDIRIDGVNVRELFQYCESLENMGCGLYPRARFVHMDVRLESVSWQDDSTPGSRHATESVPDSDETVAEVMADAAPVRDGGGDR
jgi:uncharacterized protein YcbK (DUF882 family)